MFQIGCKIYHTKCRGLLRNFPHISSRYCGLRWGVVQDLYRPQRFAVDSRSIVYRGGGCVCPLSCTSLALHITTFLRVSARFTRRNPGASKKFSCSEIYHRELDLARTPPPPSGMSTCVNTCIWSRMASVSLLMKVLALALANPPDAPCPLPQAAVLRRARGGPADCPPPLPRTPAIEPP